MTEPTLADSQRPSLYIGCPIWAFAQWKGSLFTAKATRREFLSQYASVFNTVEVNSTFYALPGSETIEQWCDQTPAGFRFCLKFPKSISHEAKLFDCGAVTDAFLSLLSTLQQRDRLGPAFLQLPPYFSGTDFGLLEQFLRSLPKEFSYAVEVRHRDWFDEGECERGLDQLLTDLGMDRCLFDSRSLFSAAPTDETEKEAQRRKPRSPFRTTVTGEHPMVRVVGRNDVAAVEDWWNDWAEIAACWLQQGLSPYLFTHAPNELFAPALGEKLWGLVNQHCPDVPPMPAWPGRAEITFRQPTLF
ncbi:DUF72 domain-containing protein [Thalassoglobus sp.]|uniref:DUF72 domain-containing protein n=1 Tax=Thalassoglobus sp. TaxID=2795869 RepID=UPI003AA8192B